MALTLLGYRGITEPQGAKQQQIMLSPDKRAERQQEITQRRVEYNQRLEDLQQAAARRQQELVQPVYDKISTILSQIRDEEDYTMIFDAAAGALIAADTTLDITGHVIERIQASEAQENPSN
jgi:Skp family chaperone for outer membrane proteins